MYNILIIANYDSFLKSAVRLAERISHRNIDIGIHYVRKKQLSVRQLTESNAISYNIISYDKLNNEDYCKYDIIILSVGNGATRSFFKKFIPEFSGSQKRPIIISIFPGVIFGQTDSILSRIHSDIILANSESDTQIISEIANIYKINTTTLNYGLINIDTQFKKNNFNHTNKNVFFIDQVKIPESRKERIYIISQLIRYAKLNPEHNVFIKTRIQKNESTVHQDKNSYSSILKNMSDIPKNLKLFTDSMEDAYTKMDICIGFSSTAIVEALYYKIPAFIISDLGIRYDLYNHKFIKSNLFISFEQLIKNEEINYRLDKNWYNENIHFDINRDNILHSIIKERIENPISLSSENLFGGGFRFKTIKTNVLRKTRKLIMNPRLFFRDSKIFQYLIRGKQ